MYLQRQTPSFQKALSPKVQIIRQRMIAHKLDEQRGISDIPSAWSFLLVSDALRSSTGLQIPP